METLILHCTGYAAALGLIIIALTTLEYYLNHMLQEPAPPQDTCKTRLTTSGAVTSPETTSSGSSTVLLWDQYGFTHPFLPVTSTPISKPNKGRRLNTPPDTPRSIKSAKGSEGRKFLQSQLVPELEKQIGYLDQLDISIDRVTRFLCSLRRCHLTPSGTGISQAFALENRLKIALSTYATSLRQTLSELKRP